MSVCVIVVIGKIFFVLGILWSLLSMSSLYPAREVVGESEDGAIVVCKMSAQGR